GAEGVILFACASDLCHYGRGSRMANSRAQVVRNVIHQSGGDPAAVQVVQMIGREAKEFAATAQKAVDAIKGRNGG
ncbi:MAG: hydrogenase iron-sulfur subunit, partial [Candidatus Hermodarchaeia archaeon]